MADRLVIQIDGDSSGLTKALQSAENRLNNFNTRISNSSRALTNMMKQMAAMNTAMANSARSFQQATQSVTNFSNRLNSVRGGINSVGNQARSSTGQVNNLAGAFRNVILSLYTISTLFYTAKNVFGGFIGSVVEANSKMERMSVLLKNISTQGTEAGRSLEARANAKFLWDMADNAPFKIDALTESFVKLKASGIDPTDGSMKALVDTVSYFGGDSEVLKRAGLAISQMLSKGKVSAEELRQQLGDAIPNAMKDMATAVGKTVPELDAAMKKGLVLSADAVPKLFELWKTKYGGAAASMMTTWSGLMSQMSNAWQKTLVRITQDAGTGSLFDTLKTKALELINFLNSAQGDKFLTDLSFSLGQAVTMFADAVKWAIQYRDQILSVGKALLTLWAAGKAIDVVKGLAASFGSALVYGPRLVATFLELSRAPFPAVNIMNALGGSLSRVGQTLGIFVPVMNAANTAVVGFTVSLRALLLTLGLSAGLLFLVGAVAAAFYVQSQRTAELKQRTEQLTGTIAGYTQRRLEAAKAEEAFNAETGKMSADHKNQLDRIASLTGQIDLMATAWGRTAVEAKRARLEMAAATIAQQKKVYDDAVRQRNELYDRTKESLMRPAPGMMGPGLSPLKSSQVDVWGVISGSQEQKNVDAQYKNWRDAQRRFTEEQQRKIDASAPPKIEPLSGGNSKRDPLGDLDGSRSQLVNLMMQQARLNAELNNGTEAFDQNAEAIEDNFREQVKSIKSMGDLNAAIAGVKGTLPGLKDAVKQHNKEMEIATRVTKMLDDIQAKATDQNIQATDALDKLNTGYEGVTASVERYINKLRHQYDDVFKYGTAEQQVDAENKIRAAGHDYALELLADEAKAAKQKTVEIQDSLLTEDQAREAAYQREVARIQALIDAQRQAGIQNEAVSKAYYDYLATLQQQRKIQNNPFAKWALDARDMKGKVNEALTGSLDNFINDLAEGKAAFGDFAKSLIKDLLKIIIRALIAKAILSALGLGGVGGGSGGAGVDGLPADPFASGLTEPSLVKYTTAHTGAIVGGKVTGMTSVHPGVFAFAKKYHSGGFPGLKDNEVPIIAKKGEGVFTPEQMKALGEGRNVSPVAPQINIINQTGTQITSDQAVPRMNGEQMIVDVVLKNISKPGPLRDAVTANRR